MILTRPRSRPGVNATTNEVPSDPSRPGDDTRADLTLFDDAGPGDVSSEASERSAA
jgi:hypothetical protein